MKKRKAWTLIETSLMFMCIAVIAAVAVSVFRPREISVIAYYYGAFTGLEKINREIVFKSAASPQTLPTGANAYCNDIVRYANVADGTNCTTSTLPTPTVAGRPNFVLSNGVAFYGMEGGFDASGNKLIWVDLDGPEGRNSDTFDLVSFRINKDGSVAPMEFVYSGATLTVVNKNLPNYIRAKVSVIDQNRDVVSVTSNLSYMQASCLVNSPLYTASECSSMGYSRGTLVSCFAVGNYCKIDTIAPADFSAIFGEFAR